MSKLPTSAFHAAAFPLVAVLLAGSFPVPAAARADPSIAVNHIRIHYYRPDGNYSGWTVYAFGDTTEDIGNYNGGPVQVTGTDAFGAYFDVGVTATPQNVGLILHNPSASGGDVKDVLLNEFVNPSAAGNEYWAISGIDALYTSQPTVANEPSTLESGYARIHYYRSDGDYANWAVYSFDDTKEPADFNEGPTFATAFDSYGPYYDVKLKQNPQDLGFVVHNVQTGAKDPGPDMHLAVAQYNQAWIISGDRTVYNSQPTPGQILNSGFSRLQAFWIDRATIAIQPRFLQPGGTYSLVYSPAASLQISSTGVLIGGIAIALTPASFTSAELTRFPQLSSYAAFHLPGSTDTAVLKQALKGQLAVAAYNASGALKYLTGVQAAGVLDDLFYYSGSLGAVFTGGADSPLTIDVWAPTAQSMKLLLYNGQSDSVPAESVAMTENNGVWTAKGGKGWKGKYYLLEVVVYVPSQHKILENLVTDPYSVDLALNGAKSRITDLTDPSTKPEGWDSSRSPLLRAKNDLSIYELHVRDFSANDPSVAADNRGTYLAFTDPGTYGMRHLKQLSEAGLKAVHLMPTFHIASINEDKSTWRSPGDLSLYPPDGTQQQAAIAAVQTTDAYNWGYDPVHYFAPDGAYAHNPDNRVEEYRQMVLGLHRIGLRVIQDVVFNHTTSSGEAPNSVLDEIVPGYYYRLDADGNVENGSCCSDTASEHLVMEKLMIDTVVQNAREYKIDGFRFDLMSFHFVYNMQHIQQALAQLTLAADGIDGSKIYLYGEGWETSETASNALGPNASQVNLYDTGIGTFNDRIRDGIRGGGPFSDQRVQGFATGLFTDSSAYTNQNQGLTDQQLNLLQESDWIRAGLAGNLRDFTFIDSAGKLVKASDVSYNGQGAGYTAVPLEAVNYCSVHDNLTLFDAIQLKAAIPGAGFGDPIESRVRRQMLAMSLIALGQGVPFFLAGDELLRSKDMDDNSYDSGDWFNRLDFTYQSNNWGIGLPIASQNQNNWPIMRPLLQIPALRPAPKDIALARDAFQEFLTIRNSSLLFRIATLSEIQNNLHFLNTGPLQVPGLIVMKLDANGGSYGSFHHIVVVFNARNSVVSFQNDALKGLALSLHPAQASSKDSIVRQSSFDANTGIVTVPYLTTTVFVSDQE